MKTPQTCPLWLESMLDPLRHHSVTCKCKGVGGGGGGNEGGGGGGESRWWFNDADHWRLSNREYLIYSCTIYNLCVMMNARCR